MSGNLFLSIDFGSTPSTDNGDRPYKGANVLWNNTSIWMDGGPTQTQTRVGTPTTVRVRVSNKGTAPVEDVKVKAYVMNPHIGITTPSQAIATLSGTATADIGPGSTSTPEHHIVSCLVNDPNQGSIPWTPTQTDLDNSIDGHLCLIANAFGNDDGADLPDGQSFDVVNDPHQGQRNIALLAVPPGPHIRTLPFQIMPLPDLNDRFLVDIVQVDPARLGRGEQWLLRSRGNISFVAPAGGGERRLVIPGRDGRPAIPVLPSRRRIDGTILVENEPIRAESRLQAGRDPLPGQLQFAVPDGDAGGSLHAFDIVQRDDNGRPLGGLRVLVVQTH